MREGRKQETKKKKNEHYALACHYKAIKVFRKRPWKEHCWRTARRTTWKCPERRCVRSSFIRSLSSLYAQYVLSTAGLKHNVNMPKKGVHTRSTVFLCPCAVCVCNTPHRFCRISQTIMPLRERKRFTTCSVSYNAKHEEEKKEENEGERERETLLRKRYEWWRKVRGG